jgi:3-hydroxyisobutyrate dehydrogenase-like beta-hydroxyacid dehydrogenase
VISAHRTSAKFSLGSRLTAVEDSNRSGAIKFDHPHTVLGTTAARLAEMEEEVTTLGFVGLGGMGAHMVRHLLSHGFPVSVYDVNGAAMEAAAALGATACATPKEVADVAEAVLVCLPTPDIVRAVALGPNGLAEGRKIRIFVDHSTTGPSVACEVAVALECRQITALDAPLAGGVAGAESGALSVMVSGAEWAFEALRSTFESFGRNVVRVGDEVGQGQALKLVNNMIVGATLVATCEAMLFGVKAGLSAQVMLDMLNVSTARSLTSEKIIPNSVLSRAFDFGFRLELMRKDLRLCVSEAEALGVPMLACTAVKQIYDIALAGGRGKQDMTRVVEELEHWAGASLSAPQSLESQTRDQA